MHFLAHIHTKDTNFIFGTPHTQYRYTQTNGHTQTHMDTDVVRLSHFALFVTCMYAKDTNFIFGMLLHNLGVCPPLKPGSFQQTRVPNSLLMGVN